MGILPGFRMLSHTIEFHCNGELLRYVRIVWSIISIGFLITSRNKVIRLNLIVTIVSTVILLSLLKPTIRNLSIFTSLKLTSETVFRCNSKWHSFEESGLVL